MTGDQDKKTALFCDCFGEDEESVRELFACDDITTVCIYDKDRLAAMASLVPVSVGRPCCSLEHMATLERRISGYYIYGVCVDRKYRQRGFFRSVMQKAEETAKDARADFICLIPSDLSLAETYRRYGYNVQVAQVGEVDTEKKIYIMSDVFRRYAVADDSVAYKKRMRGLLKVLNKDVLDVGDDDISFGDQMGDI